MEDPLFDPWSAQEDSTPAEASSPRRWRSPNASLTTKPPTWATRPAAAEPPRLLGIPGFLRLLAVPSLEDTALRLNMARHEAWIEDLLESPAPVARLTLRPWQGPWEHRGSVEGYLEIGIDDDDDEMLTLQSWVMGAEDAILAEERLPASRFSASWLQSRTLDFIERVLSAA
jgi:hypothetical protein